MRTRKIHQPLTLVIDTNDVGIDYYDQKTECFHIYDTAGEFGVQAWLLYDVWFLSSSNPTVPLRWARDYAGPITSATLNIIDLQAVIN